jgi:hypothetical protein
VQQMENGGWLSHLIPGAGQFYLWQETNLVGAKNASIACG